ncbi:MAG: PTS sugar transporter subunit IIA [Spirochaetales bacterium]|nr:PTS sugar transporter subunit IIA [Spirochaetales bacterium]
MGQWENNPIMTLSEVADYLKVAERTALRLVHKGQLPGTKVGNQWRFFKPIIDEWLFSNIGNLEKAVKEQEDFGPLGDYLKPSHILLNIKAGTKEFIFKQLLAPLVEAEIIGAPQMTIMKLLHRENISSTGIGNGVAFPHIRDPRENPPGCPPIIIGVCRPGADYDALDGKPVRLFFLLCSHLESMHLNIMSRLSHILLDESFRNNLIRSATPEELISLISQKESSGKR